MLEMRPFGNTGLLVSPLTFGAWSIGGPAEMGGKQIGWTGVNDADYNPPFPLTAKLNRLTIKVDRPQLSAEDIKKLQGVMTAAADGPVSEDLSLVQRLEERFEKREDCRKQADAQKLGPIERIQFVRKCLQ